MRNQFALKLYSNILFGANTISSLGRILSQYGNRVMIVSCPYHENIEKQLNDLVSKLRLEGFDIILYDAISPILTTMDIDSACEIARSANVKTIIGFGGAAAIDAAKAISVGCNHTSGIWNYCEKSNPMLKIDTSRLLRVIAVCTTFCGGTHVLPFAMVTNPMLKLRSKLAKSMHLCPSAVIADTNLMQGTPDEFCAHAGFSAFSNALKIYISTQASPFEELLSLEAIRLVIQYLPRVLLKDTDTFARSQVAYADTLAGLSAMNIGVSVPEIISNSVVANYPNISQGQSLALSYPMYLEAVPSTLESKYATIARMFDKELIDSPDNEAAVRLKTLLASWLDDNKIYKSCDELSIPPDMIDLIVNEIMGASNDITTHLPLNEAYMRSFIRNLWEG